jgi:hypothetical protein
MQQILAALFSLFVSTSDATALIRTANDTRLTVETAAQHLTAARFAAAVTDTDPDLLLAIAHHEARYELNVVGPPVHGLRACGVMQHTPTASCPEASLINDYLTGARHLEEWIQAQHGDIRRALIGYAGGYALLALCDRGEAPRTCSIARVFQARAQRIKRARELGAAS